MRQVQVKRTSTFCTLLSELHYVHFQWFNPVCPVDPVPIICLVHQYLLQIKGVQIILSIISTIWQNMRLCFKKAIFLSSSRGPHKMTRRAGCRLRPWSWHTVGVCRLTLDIKFTVCSYRPSCTFLHCSLFLWLHITECGCSPRSAFSDFVLLHLLKDSFCSCIKHCGCQWKDGKRRLLIKKTERKRGGTRRERSYFRDPLKVWS